MESAVQFETASYGALRPDLTCGSCNEQIANQYFEANGVLLCKTCSQKLGALVSGSIASKLWGFLRATLFGIAAAIVGAAIYYAVLAGTGYQVGLISILVGVIVGKAVHKGSRHRGGWGYQLLAMFLTYLAIASTFVPIAIKAAHEHRKKEALATIERLAQEQRAAYAIENGTQGGSKPAAIPAPVRVDAAPAKNPSAIARSLHQLVQARNNATGISAAALGLLTMLVGTMALPILVGMHDPISLLIIAFGVFEAWKLNKRAPVEMSGPHELLPEFRQPTSAT